MDEQHTRSQVPLSRDAALVAALAGTAMPFSHSAQDQAERWLRALRMHGEVGAAMQALGIGEAPLETESGEPPSTSPGEPPLAEGGVEPVVRGAERVALKRGADNVTTADLLFALLHAYGRRIDDALESRGASRQELIDKLAATERRDLSRR